jgi:parvulin-like peptidyl-prolyl isomerase
MTSSIKSRLPGQTPAKGPQRVHREDPEERFARRVTLLFVGLIVAVVVIVVLAFVYDYYVGHLKPVATVGGTSITRDQWSDRAKVEYQRLVEQEQTTREQISAGTLSPDEANVRLQDIASAKNNVASTSIENLIDLTFKGQLAEKEGLSVSDADVDDAIMKEGTTPEVRDVSVIAVTPEITGSAPTPADNQRAFALIQEAQTALEAGTEFAEVAKLFSTDESSDDGGRIGFLAADSTLDPAFVATLFATDKGGVTPVIKGDDGTWRIGMVNEIRAGNMDGGFEQAMRDTVGWDLFRSHVRKEVLAQKLEDKVLAEATGGDVDQAHVAEILLEADTIAAPSEDEGRISAAHILYSPNDDPSGAQTLDPADPAWEAARIEAQAAADQLNKVADKELRAKAFATRAKSQSDDTGSGANGGDLGYFSRDMMVPEFADPLFDNAELQPNDIVGPVKSAFGYHVILFQDRTPGVQERLDEVVAALAAEGADFGEVAKQLSNGAEASIGGDLGWRAQAQMDEAAWTAVTALEAGAWTDEAIPEDDGYHFYQLIEQGKRPLDVVQKAILGATVFDDWYAPQKEQAITDDVITRDGDLFSNTPQVGG